MNLLAKTLVLAAALAAGPTSRSATRDAHQWVRPTDGVPVSSPSLWSREKETRSHFVIR